MKNKNKVRKLALSMQTKTERLLKGEVGSPFLSVSWGKRTKAIQDRVKKQVARVKIRKMEREEALKADKSVVYSIK